MSKLYTVKDLLDAIDQIKKDNIGMDVLSCPISIIGCYGSIGEVEKVLFRSIRTERSESPFGVIIETDLCSG